jgi:hypothetical protein
MGYSFKEVIRNFVAVVLGVLLGLIIYLCISLAANARLNRMEKINNEQFSPEIRFLFGGIGLFLGSLAGGSLTSSISTRKKRLHSIVTGLVLGFIFILQINEDKFPAPPLAWLLLAVIPLAGYAGSFLTGKTRR